MSDGYLYSGVSGYIDEQVNNKSRNKNSVLRKTRIIKILVLVLSGLLVLEALIYAIIIPCSNPVQISFTGNKNLTINQLYGCAGSEIQNTWIKFNCDTFASNLSLNAAIESVEVEKRFPDKVLVTIHERVPVAASLVNIDGKTVPVQIDKNGVLFSVNKDIPSTDIPLVTGLAFESLTEGTRLHPKLRPIMEQIEVIQQKNPGYFSVISEIRVMPKDYGDYELMLYPIHTTTRVRTDRTLTEESLQYIMVVLDVMEKLNLNVEEIDLRYGSISYKTN